MENFSLYLAKFLITAYTSILAPLLPLLMLEMKLSLTQAGGLVSLFSLFNSLLQPAFGWVQDRIGWRPFLLAAPLWVGSWMGALGTAPGFGALAAIIFLAGIGVCAFHPASFAAAAGRGSGKTVVISLLLLSSSLGFVAGPALISAFVSRFGIGDLWLICLPGIAATLVLYRTIPGQAGRGGGRGSKALLPFRAIVSPVLPFFMAALSISIAAMNLYTFLPILLKGRGVETTTIGIYLSAFALGCAAGPLIGAAAAGRFGRFPTILSASVLSLLSLAFLPQAVSGGGYAPSAAALVFAGIALMLPFSILIAMAQDRAPQYLSSVSSLLGGFAWGCGGVLVIVFAGLAESFGVEGVVGGLVLFPAFNLSLVLLTKAFRAKA